MILLIFTALGTPRWATGALGAAALAKVDSVGVKKNSVKHGTPLHPRDMHHVVNNALHVYGIYEKMVGDVIV